MLRLGAGAAGALGFTAWELRQKAPLLDVRLFRHRGLAIGTVSLVAVFGVPSGIFLVLYPYFQAVLGWSGLVSTLACLPMLVLMIVCSGLAPRLAARIGVRLTTAEGIFFGGTGLALKAALVSVDGGYLSVLPGYLVMGLGMGLAMTPSTEALNDVAREFGSALGIDLLGAVLNAGYATAIASRQGDASGTARISIAGPLSQAAKESFVLGWQQAMGAGVAVMAVVLAYVLFKGPGPRTSSGRLLRQD